jgi:aryl-alcohol dehydrogenase-like predicted oxidoreductase
MSDQNKLPAVAEDQVRDIDLTRREALRLMAAAGWATMGSTALGVGPASAIPTTATVQKTKLAATLPMVRLGRTGPLVSRICIGGWHVGEAVKSEVAQDIIRRSLELGINFFDTAHSYGRGESERRYGQGLRGRWDQVVIMSKSTQRKSDDAEREIDESLERLGTSSLDLWQFHSINSVDDARQIASKGGAGETARKALADGRIRMVGATGHNSPEGLALLLELVPEIQVCQFPVNAVDLHWKSFLKTTLPAAQKHKVGVLAMKTLAMGKLVGKSELTVTEAHRYALSQAIDVWVSGVESLGQLEENVALIRDFKLMSVDEQQRLVAHVEPLKGPKTEGYKNW